MVVASWSLPHLLVQLSSSPAPSSRVTFLLLRSFSLKSTSSTRIYPLQSSLSAFKGHPKRVKTGKWEPPVDGDESEYDEDEWTSFGDSEEHSAVSADEIETTEKEVLEKRQKEFIQEVELLLEPDEQEILQQYEFPVLSKISSPNWSPFHTLTSCNQIAFMDKLLENGYDIDIVDEYGFTPLHKAVMIKNEAVVMHLLRAGANPHVRDRDGATLLHYAVQVGSLELVKLRLKYKVDVNLADDEGWTPLHVAMQSRCRDIGKVLLVNGADKTRKTKNGKTPLDLSLCFGKDFKSYELAKLLKLVPAGLDF